MARSLQQPTLETPCVRSCCLNSEDICMGCGRRLEEILLWHNATISQREAILLRAMQRRAQLNATKSR